MKAPYEPIAGGPAPSPAPRIPDRKPPRIPNRVSSRTRVSPEVFRSSPIPRHWNRETGREMTTPPEKRVFGMRGASTTVAFSLMCPAF
jgi:hypothetical protein